MSEKALSLDGITVRKDRPRGADPEEAGVNQPPARDDSGRGTFKVADHKIDEVKDFVNANPDKVGEVLSAEKRSSDPRSTLIEWLESKQGSDLL
jgi:hypothetical protein